MSQAGISGGKLGDAIRLMKGQGIIHAVMGFGDMQDPPEYYDPAGGLLAYEAQLGNLVNESVITGDGMRLEDYRGHFDLVNAQLTQVRRPPASVIISLLTCVHERDAAGGGPELLDTTGLTITLLEALSETVLCMTLCWTVCRCCSGSWCSDNGKSSMRQRAINCSTAVMWPLRRCPTAALTQASVDAQSACCCRSGMRWQ